MNEFLKNFYVGSFGYILKMCYSISSNDHNNLMRHGNYYAHVADKKKEAQESYVLSYLTTTSLIEASQVAVVVKNPPPMQEMQETRVRSLGQEDPPEQEMATHSSGCSCLENSMNREAWQATVHGVTKSWTRLSTYRDSASCISQPGQP